MGILYSFILTSISCYFENTVKMEEEKEEEEKRTKGGRKWEEG